MILQLRFESEVSGKRGQGSENRTYKGIEILKENENKLMFWNMTNMR